jgi:hypothetical protein
MSGSCGILVRSVRRQCLCRCNIGAQFALNLPQTQKSFWTHQMILLGDEAQVEACLSPFGDSGNLDARKVRCLCQMYHRLGNHVRTHLMELLIEWVMWSLVSVRLDIVLVSVQDRCTVCAKCAIGS